MNSSWQCKFPGGQTYREPMPTPILTSWHLHSTASDVNAARPEPYAPLPSSPNDHFHVYSNAPHGIIGSPHQARAGVSGPTPPSQADFAPHAQQVQHQHLQHQHSGSSGQKLVSPTNEPILDRRGIEEEDNLAYVRSRRKAQNRAAQRAFRERKAEYAKSLEAKIAELETTQRQTFRENESLRKDLDKMSIENAILRTTSRISRGSFSTEPAGLMRFNLKDFSTSIVRNHINKFPSYRIRTSINDDESLLAVNAAWDLIIGHRLFKRGLVDIGDVIGILKHCTCYNGQGPGFSERTITSAIEQSVARLTDDLT
ncbi:hypothetical protein FOMA001_g17800 [Fusarium oxysporum f. sp. matthiolae]|nr:hypothetical protein FOMA001_g17800 [Fusarium oxysporum f. sp. matthiolae]